MVYSLWGRKELDMTEQLTRTSLVAQPPFTECCGPWYSLPHLQLLRQALLSQLTTWEAC